MDTLKNKLSDMKKKKFRSTANGIEAQKFNIQEQDIESSEVFKKKKTTYSKVTPAIFLLLV